MTGIRSAKALGIASLTVLVIGLAFRAFVYRRIYLAPGDPYGFADVIELLLGWLLVGVLFASAAVAVVLAVKGPKNNRVAAGWLMFVLAAVALLVAPLHELAARWAI